MWIQILLVVALLALGFVVLRRPGSDSHQALRRLLYGLFVLAAILSVLFPQWLSWLARLVGVGRGTDLLLYALVVMFFVFVYTQYRRNVAIQRQLTLLARRVALQQALEEERAAMTGSGAPAPDQSQAVTRQSDTSPSRSTSSNPD